MVWYNATMLRTTIDRAGRVVIPKVLRDALRLEPGDELDLEPSAGAITIRPVHAPAPLVKEQGIWVYRAGRPLSDLSILDAISEAREERTKDLLG